MKLDVLAFAAHPDDVELACGGTLLSLAKAGKKVGIVDFTAGEMGTRGTPEIRKQEAQRASKILQLSLREQLAFKDVFFANDDAHVLEVVKRIRAYRPDIVLANALADRHPDHPKAAQVVKRAVFLAGLKKVSTEWQDAAQPHWYIKNLYHYMQTDLQRPDFVVDVSEVWEARMEAVRAFKSQFFDPEGEAANTLISSPEFMDLIDSRGRELGLAIRAKYGEGFVADRVIGVSDLTALR